MHSATGTTQAMQSRGRLARFGIEWLRALSTGVSFAIGVFLRNDNS
jgi:hypothetical protein